MGNLTLIVYYFGFSAIQGVGSGEGFLVRNLGGPLAVFAFKRVLYAMSVFLMYDDHMYKNYNYHFMHAVFMQQCYLVAGSVAQVARPADVTSFIALDWILCGTRFVFLLHTFRKSCPKLFDALLVKQLENVQTPMPKASEAVGFAVSLRMNQAFNSFAEGNCLTSNLIGVAFL